MIRSSAFSQFSRVSIFPINEGGHPIICLKLSSILVIIVETFLPPLSKTIKEKFDRPEKARHLERSRVTKQGD